MSEPKTLDNLFVYEKVQTKGGSFLLRRNTFLPNPGKRKGGRKLKLDKYLGVRLRPSGKYTAEIKNPTTKQKYWLGSFDSAQEGALAYDRAALSMKKVQTNFMYYDNTTIRSPFFPLDVQAILPTSEQFFTTSEPKKETNPHSASTYHEPCIFHSQMLIQSNNNNNNYPSSLADETAYGSVDDRNSFFFLTDDSKSNYLASIVPENCLKADFSTQPSSTPSNISNFYSINQNSRCHVENHSHWDIYAGGSDITTFSNINDHMELSSFNKVLNQGFWSREQQSWEINCNELLPLMNNTPLMIEEGCMQACYPYNGNNPSYNIIPQAISCVTCSPPLPPFGNVVDLGYSLF